jgi:hypothetical protein
MQYLTTGGKLGYEELNQFTTPSILASYLPDIDDSITVEEESIRLKNCKEDSSTQIDVLIEIEGVTLICLHNKYSSPFIKAVVAPVVVRYQRFKDHEEVTGSLNAIQIYDMLNYPTSISPLKFEGKIDYETIETKYTFDKLIEAKAYKDTFRFLIFTSKCAVRPKDKTVSYTLDMKFESVEAIYIQEITLRRLKNYILNQLIYSVSPSEE